MVHLSSHLVDEWPEEEKEKLVPSLAGVDELDEEDEENDEREDFVADLPSANAGTSHMPRGMTFSFSLTNIHSALLETSRLAYDAFKAALLRALCSTLEVAPNTVEITISIGSASVQVDVCINDVGAGSTEALHAKLRAAISCASLDHAVESNLAQPKLATLCNLDYNKGQCLMATPEAFVPKDESEIADPSNTIFELISTPEGSVYIKGHFRTYLAAKCESCRAPCDAELLDIEEDGTLSFPPYRWKISYSALTIGPVRVTATALQAAPRRQRLPNSGPQRLPNVSALCKPPKALQVGDARVPLLRTSGPLKIQSVAGQPLHVVFVADTSGSMGMCDVEFGARSIKAPLSHYLGQLVADFVGKERISRLQAVRSVISEFIKLQQEGTDAGSDMYSFVEFSIIHKICFNQKSAKEAKTLLEKMPVELGCTTEYAEGLKGLLHVVNSGKVGTPVRVVFLSDGDPCDTDQMLQLFQAEFGPCGRCPYDLQFHTVGFGPDGQFASLQQLAALGRGSFQMTDCDLGELCKIFTSISTTITQTRGENESNTRLSNVRFERPHMFVFVREMGGFDEIQATSRMCHFDGSDFTWTSEDSMPVLLRQLPWTQGGMHVVAAARIPRLRDGSKMVAKVPKSFLQSRSLCDASLCASAECYAKNVAATAWFAQKFVSCLENTSLSVTSCRVLDTTGSNSYWPKCFIMEPFLYGVFIKFNNNNGYVQRTHSASDVAQAFSHFSYRESGGDMLVVDVQGICSEGVLTVSDPQILSTSCSFGRGDLGQEGMDRFFASHRCGDLCRKLGLHNVQSQDNSVKAPEKTGWQENQEANKSVGTAPSQQLLFATVEDDLAEVPDKKVVQDNEEKESTVGPAPSQLPLCADVRDNLVELPEKKGSLEDDEDEVPEQGTSSGPAPTQSAASAANHFSSVESLEKDCGQEDEWEEEEEQETSVGPAIIHPPSCAVQDSSAKAPERKGARKKGRRFRGKKQPLQAFHLGDGQNSCSGVPENSTGPL